MKRPGDGPWTIRRQGAWALLGVALAVPPIAIARGPSPKPSAAPGTRRALIVCGLPGDDEHRAMYARVVEKLARALVARCGFAAPDVWVRFGTEARADDGPAVTGSRGLSTRENVAADAEAIRKSSVPGDGV